MVEEIGAACRASMGLASKASLDPKHAGADNIQTSQFTFAGLI